MSPSRLTYDGDRAAADRDPGLAPNDPVFYYRPVDTFDAGGNFLARRTRPLTRKRFGLLFTRIRRHYPAFDARGLRPHDIRHTSGRLVYEVGGEAATQLQLGHDGGSTSELYYKERMDSLAKLKRNLFSPPADEPRAPAE